jgi:hypothetical protein
MRKSVSGVLKILGVNEHFGLGRVLEIVFICLGYPLGIFIFDEMRVSANRYVIN